MKLSVVALYNPVLWEYSRIYRWLLAGARAVELSFTLLRFVLISVPLRAIRGEREPDLDPAPGILMEGTRIDYRSDFGQIAYEREYWDKERLSTTRRGRFATVRFGIAPVVRILVEELGPTFIKLGQFMSCRPELPVSLNREFQKLQERVPPFSFKETRKIIKREYGMPLEGVFSYFEEKPLASASLAQVYRARLRREGADVAVKVQRPYLEATITIDLLLIDALLKVMKRLIPEVGKKTDVDILMTGFGGCLRKEVDFAREAVAQQNIQNWFSNNPHFKDWLKIPEGYSYYVTGKVLVMELVKGMYRLDTEEACDVLRNATSIGDPRWDVNQWPMLSIGGALLMDVWESRLFYMDSHLGNIYFIPEEKKWVLLDFGMCEEITEEVLELLADLIASLCLFRDPYMMADALLAMHEQAGGKREDVNRNRLVDKVASVVEKHISGGEAPIQRPGGLDMTADLLSSIATERLCLPPYLWYFMKSASGLVRVGLLVDPFYDEQPFMCAYMGDHFKRRIIKALEDKDVVNTKAAINKLVPLITTKIPDPEKVIPGLARMAAENDPDSAAARVRSKGSMGDRSRLYDTPK